MATRLSPYRKVEPATLDRRGSSRHSVTLSSVSTREAGEAPAVAELYDLSRFGCRVGCTDGPEPGTRIALRLSGSSPVTATVVWSRDGEMGCRFDQPIERRLMRSLVAAIH